MLTAMRHHPLRYGACLSLLLTIPLLAQTGQKRPDAPQLAPYVPTPAEVVDRMLQLGGVGKNDVVYDLGCGDGRIPITAAKTYGARGVGIGARATQPPTAGSCIHTFDTKRSGRPVLAPSTSPPRT